VLGNREARWPCSLEHNAGAPVCSTGDVTLRTRRSRPLIERQALAIARGT
jgi:hypothetical protein